MALLLSDEFKRRQYFNVANDDLNSSANKTNFSNFLAEKTDK
ncbi:hypothetical protein [Eisenibacter elegans]|nr:hypothetical protein [Eisenibacter elegans]